MASVESTGAPPNGTSAEPRTDAGSDAPEVSTLDAVSEEAQRALLARPSLSIRTRLGLGLLLWLVLSVGANVASIVLLNGVQAKLRIVGVVDRYSFEIQQARRFEKNFFLYRTNLEDALAQARAAQDILVQEDATISSVAGPRTVEAMRARVVRYASLLSGLQGSEPAADTALLRAVEAELRVQGAEMVDEAARLATQERSAADAMLRTSQRIAVGFLVGLVLLVLLLGVFVARQILAPLDRIMMATRRIAGGDLTPITPRRRYHDEFSQLAAGINHMLQELVRRQEILVQSHKLQAIGTLTAGVAHELNNPINNLMLTAAALEEEYDELDDSQRLEMATDLVKESERARDIVRNLLDFARESEVEVEPLDVEEIITETLQLAANQVKLSKVKVKGEVEENLPPVHGDRHQLTQVFLNLVLNALDAMPGGGALTISVEKSADRSCVNVRFTDTGVGIAAEHLKSIFAPFFSTKGRAKGTGLGLSVSLGIIKQHGGDIRVESEPGAGTTFTVSLPVAPVPAPERMDEVVA